MTESDLSRPEERKRISPFQPSITAGISPDARASGIRKSRQTRKGKRWESPVAGYLFIAPWLLGFCLLVFWPMLQSLYLSFTDYSLLEAAHWIGADNYVKLFTDDSTFLRSIKATAIFVLCSVPLQLTTALLVALLLNRKMRGMPLYRTILYFPNLIDASVALAIIWSNMFGRSGLVNELLLWVGIEGKNWIGMPETAMGTLIVLAAWQFGSPMVIFLSGLKQIPHELYEAASVDGARKIRTFFHITLPMLSPVLLFNLVLQMIGAFQLFTQAFIITKGGPMETTNMYALYLFDKAFRKFEMGYASAMAWVLLLIIASLTALIFATSRAWVYYESEGAKQR